jgi:DNA repair exonuclease SbcCD ATPase subunit
MYAYFKGYAGFYNGMGLESIEIDFSKAVNNIILIIGKNGSGKTTLLQHLNPFPDPSTSFLPEMDAEKRLSLFDNGDSYNIQIISQTDNKGGRKTTKAFIQKNGEELNPNGNVSSYKEIIFSEFELDSNYISLSMLSSNDRGLGDKTPSDRKKFASNIIENLEVYNDIYKTLNKKSLIFKSHINTLGDKIRNLGNRTTLENELGLLRNKEVELDKELNDIRETIGALKAKSTIDPNDALRINELQSSRAEYMEKLEESELSLKRFQTSTKIKKENVDKELSKDIELADKYQLELNTISTSISEKNNQLNSYYTALHNLKSIVENQQELDVDLENNIKESKDKIKDILNQLSSYNISPDMIKDIGIQKIDLHIDACNSIVSFVDTLYDSLTNIQDIKYVCSDVDYVSDCKNKIGSLETELLSVRESIKKLEYDAEILKTLRIKPKSCTITTCPFISEAISLKSQYKTTDLSNKLTKMLNNEKSIVEKLEELNSELSQMEVFMNKRRDLHSFLQSNYNNLYLPLFNILGIDMSIDLLISSIGDNRSLNILRDNSKVIDIRNLLIEYNTEEDLLDKLQYKFDIQAEKIKLVESNIKQIKDTEKNISQLESDLEELNGRKNTITGLLSNLNEKITREEQYSRAYKEYLDISNTISDTDKELQAYSGKTEEARAMMEALEMYNPQIKELEDKIRQVREAISERQGIIAMIDTYTNEYNDYQERYNMINLIKKYCSPSGGGIQTIFMQLYMSKTLELSNQLLGMIFGGEYQLLEFVINEKEFRIPFIGSGLPVDDISSGSASQIAIMGMIINLVLLHQGSTKFNIARLDESDASLDGRNRAYFMNIIRSAAQILEMEQVIMISHSMEEDMSNTDIIKLKGYDDYELNTSGGNIIYDYLDC